MPLCQNEAKKNEQMFCRKTKKALRKAMKSIESIVELALELIVSVNEATKCDSLSASNIEVSFVEHGVFFAANHLRYN